MDKNEIVNHQEKLVVLMDKLRSFTTDKNYLLVVTYWTKIGLPNENLSKYMEICNRIGYSDKDKEDDFLYQLAQEINVVTEEEKEAFDNLHNLLGQINKTLEIIQKENGQAEDQVKVGIIK